jgi:hypothetical protein
MLAINSDVEWTRWSVQLALMRELADRNLETAFSLWLYSVPKKVWRLFEDDGSPSEEAQTAFQLARAGLFDTNHAIGGRVHQGECNYDRAAVAKAYERLAAEGIRFPIYSNHGTRLDRQNVAGDWADYQEGDLPESDLYHLDLTLAAGARYFWCDPDLVSDKMALAPLLNGDDALFVQGLGRDGNPYLRFRRYMGTLPQGGPSLCNFAAQLDQVLNARPRGYTVLYQHLGVERKPDGRADVARLPPLRPDAARALDRLKAAQDKGDVLVTTTARLLDHAALMTAKPWRLAREGDHVTVVFDDELVLGDVGWPLEWRSVEGWAVPAGRLAGGTARLRGEERPLSEIVAEGRRYLGLTWNRIDMASAVNEAEQRWRADAGNPDAMAPTKGAR